MTSRDFGDFAREWWDKHGSAGKAKVRLRHVIKRDREQTKELIPMPPITWTGGIWLHQPYRTTALRRRGEPRMALPTFRYRFPE